MIRNALAAGIWRHYKGGLYLLIGTAHDANNEGRTTVVYVPLQLDSAHTGARMAVRTIEDWQAPVHIGEPGATWETCPGAEHCPLVEWDLQDRANMAAYAQTHKVRFAYLGPEFTADMVDQPAPVEVS